jgi:hypothetical protein
MNDPASPGGTNPIRSFIWTINAGLNPINNIAQPSDWDCGAVLTYDCTLKQSEYLAVEYWLNQVLCSCAVQLRRAPGCALQLCTPLRSVACFLPQNLNALWLSRADAATTLLIGALGVSFITSSGRCTAWCQISPRRRRHRHRHHVGGLLEAVSQCLLAFQQPALQVWQRWQMPQGSACDAFGSCLSPCRRTRRQLHLLL